MNGTIFSLLEKHAHLLPDAAAICAPGRESLTYLGLFNLLESAVAQLNSFGIGRGERVGLVLPNGPEMAAVFLACSACATAAPLNPNYSTHEFEFYLTDLQARALVVQAGSPSPAVEVARKQGIRVIELESELDSAAGLFNLRGQAAALRGQGGWVSAEDTALMLHTSGTTSRPKMVPLSGRNLAASAGNVAHTLHLTPRDRCLNIMPLFHIHGLVAALLATLATGGSVACTPGFYAGRFFEWLAECQPTWYTAVPSMHQSILERAKSAGAAIQAHPLRLIRSSSASLAPQVMASLEESFGCPVIEAYGMTEAAHQMASNPLPPFLRKPGSVGLAAGPDVTILAEDGPRVLAQGQTGEVAIRGENVTSGYVANPEANARAFSDGWFRTGDQGYFDAEGYLYLTGRLKEIINRGGEKISPREVDEALLDHPAVGQAVTFAMPDSRLGEEVAAAVVLRDAAVSEQELRRFVAERLSYFKVPKRILILDEIPKGPTGKLQRIGLADKLGLSGDAPASMQALEDAQPPSGPVEEALGGLWEEILGVKGIGRQHSFLEIGGDSISAMLLVSAIRRKYAIPLTVMDFLDLPTIAQQAELVEERILAQIEALSDDQAQGLLDGQSETQRHD